MSVMRRKVCVVVTARPSYSRIRTALTAIQAHPDLQLQLVVGASALLDRYGSAVQTIAKDGFPIDARVHMVLEGENLTTMAKTTGLGMIELASVFEQLQPDIVVTIADRYETLATAAAASYMNIPVAHIQGGEVTGSIDEKVRHAITKLSMLHLVSTEMARERVIKMGEDPTRVWVTGCPSIDIAKAVLDGAGDAFDPIAKYGGVGSSLDLSRGYLVMMQHPVTTEHDAAIAHINETLYATQAIGLPILCFWPNVDAGSDGTSKGLRVFRETADAHNFHFFKNMLPEDFLRLLLRSKGIVGNSSVGIRECAFLGVPAVNIGTRQRGRERGRNVIDVPHDRAAIQAAIERHLETGPAPSDPIYGDGQAGRRIADALTVAPLGVEKQLTY